MNDLETKIRLIAFHLSGDWVFNEILSNPELKQFYITSKNKKISFIIDNKTRLFRVSSLIDIKKTYSLTHLSGNFNLESRNVLDLVNDINKRILKDYDDAILKNEMDFLNKKKMTESKKYIFHAIEIVSGGFNESRYNNSCYFNIDKMTFNFNDRYNNLDSFDISINNISADLMIKLIGFLKENSVKK